MARMIPDYIHSDCKSNAERRLFEQFKHEVPENYTVFHSLGLAKHACKLRAEIDFVVANQRGILCIEVKGGRIKQERGVWFFINRYDEVNTKRESPFEQASSAMYALRRGINKKFGWSSPQCNAILGYCVIFPDQPFSMESPEWDLKRLIDENKAKQPLQTLIEEQFDYSAQEIKRVAGKECGEMAPAQFKLLLKYLRPDFEVVPSLSSRISENHDNLLRLTEEQFDVLDQLGANDRIMISGGAGTGKTLLAVEKARREVQNDKRVIYICYNKLLAMHIRQVLKKNHLEGRIEVNTLHGYARKLISKAALDDALPAEGDKMLFTQRYPELFEQAFVEVFDEPPFDVMIIDEGQDLKSVRYIGMLDWLVEGGMQDGRWIWFEDSQQNIFKPNDKSMDDTFFDKYHPAVCRLTQNCRNTKPISVFNSLATGTAKQKCMVNSDLKVSPVFYKSRGHQIKLLENIITKLLGGGVEPAHIILLSHYVVEKSILHGLSRIGGIAIKPYDEEIGHFQKCLRHTTIQKFKGLESRIVIVTDIDNLKSHKMRSLNYVAFSRPTSCLEVLIHEDTREQYGQLAYEYGLGD